MRQSSGYLPVLIKKIANSLEGAVMIRKPEKYPVEHILPQIGGMGHRITLDGDRVNVYSTRLLNFKEHGTKCVDCGLEGTYFVKEKAERDPVYHINLYGINGNGKEVLFTKDHIIPKSKGGKDTLKNLQTMCFRCNERKDDTIPKNKRGIVIASKLLKASGLIAPSVLSLSIGMLLIHTGIMLFGYTLTFIGAFSFAQYFYRFFHKGMNVIIRVQDGV